MYPNTFRNSSVTNTVDQSPKTHHTHNYRNVMWIYLKSEKSYIFTNIYSTYNHGHKFMKHLKNLVWVALATSKVVLDI